MEQYLSEIRQSVLSELLEKVKKNKYANYLKSLKIHELRHINNAEIRFDFPVTALIGTNGSGKSTILSSALYSYSKEKVYKLTSGANRSQEIPLHFQRLPQIDSKMKGWQFSAEIIDRKYRHDGSITQNVIYKNESWRRNHKLIRNIMYIGIERTLPVFDTPYVMKRNLKPTKIEEKSGRKVDIIDKTLNETFIKSAVSILGNPLNNLKLIEIVVETEKKVNRKNNDTRDRDYFTDETKYRVEDDGEDFIAYRKFRHSQYIFSINNDNKNYSEFNFGSGESCILRLVYSIEDLEDYSLVLIEEIENGIHPVALKRLVEYLIDVSQRKKIQIIFTTHSDYALAPLPSEAIWSVINGKFEQGKLSVESLRSITGLVDRELSIFVEDDFAKEWLTSFLRIHLDNNFFRVGVFKCGNDSKAVSIHKNHLIDPSTKSISLCVLDGDSSEEADEDRGIYKLPGTMPETEIFNYVHNNITSFLAVLTASLHIPLGRQDLVANVLKKVSCTNRDQHLIFNQIGIDLGLISEELVRSAFLSIWNSSNLEKMKTILERVKSKLNIQNDN
ncbi:MAG: AAA family ATPase [Desulfococcaceae bacterium]